jgi:hypothetical protein
MRRLLLSVGMLLVSTVSLAPAQTSLGEVCWNLAPFNDVIRAGVVQMPAPPTSFFLTGRWRSVDFYQLLFTGDATEVYPPQEGVLFQLGLNATNPSEGFNGNDGCTLNATLNSSLTGTWTFGCPDTAGVGPFSNQGSMALVSCADEPDPSAPSLLSARDRGRAAGD